MPIDSGLATELLERLQHQIDPPGCMTAIVEHPTKADQALEVAIVHRHRFAFFYWMKWWLKSQDALSLLTIDWHDDVGGECDFDPSLLTRLNLHDSSELALFCWAGLRSLDDGHIAPAAYLGAFSEVDAIVKQFKVDGDEYPQNSILNYEGDPCHIRYHSCPSSYLQNARTRSDPNAVVLDLDLDYFTTESATADLEEQSIVADNEIRQTLDPSSPFMSSLLDHVVGISIALEPHYCGSLRNSHHLLDVVCETLFSKSPFVV